MATCPCELAGPCSAQCSCRHPLRSGGCFMCVTHGSEAQKRAAAQHLMKRSALNDLQREMERQLELAQKWMTTAEKLHAENHEKQLALTEKLEAMIRDTEPK